jgi:hypothetical protein
VPLKIEDVVGRAIVELVVDSKQVHGAAALRTTPRAQRLDLDIVVEKLYVNQSLLGSPCFKLAFSATMGPSGVAE